MSNNLDKQYIELLEDILENGVKKSDRTGTGTLSVFGRQIKHKMSEGFPLLTSKRMALNSIKTELSFFIKGLTDIRYLWKHKCYIWDGDFYKRYKTQTSSPYSLEELKQKVKEGDTSLDDSIFDLGPIYGSQWKNWNGEGIDQLTTTINKLMSNPDSRRMLISSWNVGKLGEMVLPPCHVFFQIYTRKTTLEERIQWVMRNVDLHMENLAITEEAFKPSTPQRAISLQWYQRSVDVPLGLPFNIASYGFLLEAIAEEVNMISDELIGLFGDTHIYLNQIEGVKEQISRKNNIPPLPQIQIQNGISSTFTQGSEDVKILNYNPLPRIKFPLSN